ncbi:Transcriptional regulator of competence genes, TfoX/Sxy family [Pseudoxanthomonas sp. GM95]|uniref:TfoX/Sxy family protein n=1 Tax=Pseudoxanthomonas sp. GM95 TaxID=1881043 RepID=UPI0008AFB9C2|nr:TfoX/Sxy family protein [Pseudoxanthomonas sp. GM95]SEM23624.1 Transcriptional regulator of competence genes, TfoX/Sxy family [Pseudoxanthomonas sp. GM95]
MATDADFIEYVHAQAALGAALASKKMFGEYALYLDDKVVALVCDNQVFLKPTTPGRALLHEVIEQPPYPGAKPHYLLADALEDTDTLQRLLRATADALPLPKPKKTATKAAKPAPAKKAATKQAVTKNVAKKPATKKAAVKKTAVKKTPAKKPTRS